MFNPGDVGDKFKIGLTKENVTSFSGAVESTKFGLKWLHLKAYSFSTDGKATFMGWEYAIKKYGPGKKERTYQDTVKKIYKSIITE